MQNGMSLEIFAQIAIEGRKGVGGCESFFKQKAHRITFIAKRRLHADQNIAKLLTQHKDGAAIAQLATRCGTPLGLDFFQPTLALDMFIGADERVHIGVGAVLRGIAVQQSVAQIIHTGRQFHLVTLNTHRTEGVPQRLKNRQVSCASNIACVGGEVEQHDGDFSVLPLAAFQGHQFAHPSGQHDGPLRTGMHVLCVMALTKGAGMVATGASNPSSTRASAKNHRAGRSVQFGNGHHDGALHWQQAPVRSTPLVQGLKLNRVRRNIGHIELGQHLFGCFGVVVGGPSHQ